MSSSTLSPSWNTNNPRDRRISQHEASLLNEILGVEILFILLHLYATFNSAGTELVFLEIQCFTVLHVFTCFPIVFFNIQQLTGLFNNC